MIKKILKRRKSDSGAAELISLLILIPLMLGVIFTIIDSAIYFNNRSIVQSVARDGARSVAIMGGNGTSALQSPIEKQYGIARSSACSGISNLKNVSQAYKATSTAIECNVMKTLGENNGLVNITVTNVICSPQITNSISQRTSCAISWRYGSIPASALTVIKSSDGKNGLVADNKSVGTAESEVDMSSVGLVNRSN